MSRARSSTADTSDGQVLAYKPRDAAEQIGCSRAQIYRLMERGELPSVKFGASRRILHEDLVAFLRGHRAGAA